MSLASKKKTLMLGQVLALTVACGAVYPEGTRRRPIPKDPETKEALDADGLASFAVDPQLPFYNNFDSVMAASESGLARSMIARIASENAVRRGVLPQILVPSVREEVSSNKMLPVIQSLPAGIGSILVNAFASDEKLTEKIQEGVQEKLNRGTASYGGSNLRTRLAFNFDHFSSSGNDKSTFDIASQAGRWNLAWAEDGIWTGGPPLDGYDHGLQVLGILRNLSEWSYLFGIGNGGNLSGIGGLTKRWESGNLVISRPLIPTDPLISNELLTGSFQIAFPTNVSSLDLATHGGEQWRSDVSTVPLLEQASLWLAGAKAFSRLRIDHRRFSSDLFTGISPVLSSSVSMLPLLFLNSMSTMLDGPFINSTSHKIYNVACAAENCELADARSVARLALALARWNGAISNVDTAGLDAATQTKLLEATPKLKAALQLVIQTLTGELTEEVQVEGQQWLAVKTSINSILDRSSVSAEVIGTLTYIERNILNSELIRERITVLANGHAATFYRNSESIKTGESLVWNARMVRELELSKLGDVLPWLQKGKETLKAALGQDWVEP
jgi:hypothetical protein